MDNKELRVGNFVKYKGTEYIATVDLIHGKKHFDCRDEYGSFTPNGKYEPIPLTEEWVLKFGFKPIPHMTVMNSFTYDLGRDRVISIGCVGTPNEMIFLIEDYSKRVPSQDICVLRNFDYDGRTYVHTLQNIVHSLTGKELVYNA